MKTPLAPQPQERAHVCARDSVPGPPQLQPHQTEKRWFHTEVGSMASIPLLWQTLALGVIAHKGLCKVTALTTLHLTQLVPMCPL